VVERVEIPRLRLAKRGWVLLFQHDSPSDEARKQLKDAEPSGREVESGLKVPKIQQNRLLPLSHTTDWR